MFPTTSSEEFWEKIETLQPDLKLKILETEILNEQNFLFESKKDQNNTHKAKMLEKKEEELVLYQKFLENECAEIQKHWNAISKIADGFDKNPCFPTGFSRGKSRSLAALNKITGNHEFLELNNSCAEFQDSFSDF